MILWQISMIFAFEFDLNESSNFVTCDILSCMYVLSVHPKVK